MNRIFFLLAGLLLAFAVKAQTAGAGAFKGRLFNQEYRIYIEMNFYQNDVVVPGQELFGQLPGYFGSTDDSRKWLFTNVKLTDATNAEIKITNDYGSEDLTATLSLNADSTYTLKQLSGSTLKIARNRKWVKIPKVIVFTRKK